MSRLTRVLLGGVSTLAVLVVMELLSRSEMLDEKAFPPVTRVGVSLAGMLNDVGYWHDVKMTMAAWAIGLGISVLAAVPLGILIGAVPWLYEWVRTLIEFLRPIPPVALIPLAILVFGPTQSMKIFLIVAAAVWPMLFQTLYGVRDVDGVLTESARTFQMSGWLRARFIVLPSTLPYLVTGLRISATIALIVAIAAELVSGAGGLGASIRFAQSAASTTEAWALIVTVGAIGLLINAVFRSIERKLLHWHPSQRMGIAT